MSMPETIIMPLEEHEADERTREIFDDIRATLEVARVPDIFRIMARLPLYLETSWRRFRFAFVDDGHLGVRTKWMIGLAVSASNNNKTMIVQCTERLKALGVNDAEIAELMAVVDVANGLNKTLKAVGAAPGALTRGAGVQ